MKAMDAIAQVTLSSERHFSSLVSDIHCNLFFQLCRLPVLHLVAQTRSVEKVMEVRSVSVVLVTKVTGTFVQVGMRNTVLWLLEFGRLRISISRWLMASGNHDSPY